MNYQDFATTFTSYKNNNTSSYIFASEKDATEFADCIGGWVQTYGQTNIADNTRWEGWYVHPSVEILN